MTDTLPRDLISQELGFYSAIVNDSLAYVSTYSTGSTLWRYNPRTGAHSAIHGRFGTETGGALALNAQRTILFHAGFGRGTVAIIDAATGTLIDSIAGLSGAIYAATYSDPLDALFVGTLGHLYAIDISTRTITADLPLTEGVNHLALSPSGDRLYAVRFGSNPTYHSDVLEIDPITLSVVRTIVSGYMHGILVAQNGQELFAAGDVQGIVHCSLDVTPTCGRTGFDTCSTLGVVQSPDGTTLYGTGGCVAIYSLPALTLTRVVYTGFGSWAPSVHPQLPYFLQVQQGPAWAFKSYY